jgi:hypothetical protein
LGCKWSLVQIQSPRLREGRSISRETDGAAAFCFGASGGTPYGNPTVGRKPVAEPFPAATRIVLPEKLLTVRAVADRLGVCRATVYAMVKSGELRCMGVSNAFEFTLRTW